MPKPEAVAVPTNDPLLVPKIVFALPSPGHQLIRPGGADVQGAPVAALTGSRKKSGRRPKWRANCAHQYTRLFAKKALQGPMVIEWHILEAKKLQARAALVRTQSPPEYGKSPKEI